LDVRLMNRAAAALMLAFALLIALMGVRLLARWSAFDLQQIVVTGDSHHSNSATLRANVAPHIAGTFFSVDLDRVRATFEAVPWVRAAVVKREFPNRLHVVLQEHQPVALWGGDGDARLLNNYGEIFEANVGEVDQDNLPTLSGPDGQAVEVLAMYQGLAPLFSGTDTPLMQLRLSARGSWSAGLDGGATVELGRGTLDEVRERTRRLMRTVTQVAARYGRQPNTMEYADLRHENGYAIRLRGVTTEQAVQAKQPKSAH
jgi:cell division protein FtsQ